MLSLMGGIPAIFNLGTGEIIIIALIVLLLFGGSKIPELMRGIGKGIKSFKEGMKDVTDEINEEINSVDDTKPRKK